MKLTRRKFLKWLATFLAAWGIAPAALAKSADNGPGLAQLPAAPEPNLYFRQDGSSYEAYEPEPFKGVTVCARIISGRPVRFNSKDFGVVVIKSQPNIKWIDIK